jgi:hypothetical protein
MGHGNPDNNLESSYTPFSLLSLLDEPPYYSSVEVFGNLHGIYVLVQ